MSDERILEVVENQDKYYILGFIKGLKTNIDELQQENQQLKIQISAREEEYKKLEDNWDELMEDIQYILEIIEHNKDVIKVTSDEELAIYSLQNKMQELERGVSDVED